MAEGANRIFEVECIRGKELVLRFRPVRVAKMPPEVRQHVAAAGRETLLALRSFIDAALKYSELKETRSEEGRTKIEVE